MHGRECLLLGVVTVTIAIAAVFLHDKGKCRVESDTQCTRSGVQMLPIYFEF